LVVSNPSLSSTLASNSFYLILKFSYNDAFTIKVVL
jgi:hypothetical protein